MHELDRRSMLKVVAAFSLVPYSALADEKESTVQLVERGTDRTGATAQGRTCEQPFGLQSPHA
jgi:hypothetical protein